MNRPCSRLALVVAGAMICLLAGCAVPSHVTEPGNHGPECAVIQSASAISSPDERFAELRQIAATTGLTEHEQMYLIDATLYGDQFSSGQSSVFVTLANNPSMTQHTREYLADQLRQANLDPEDQARITQALAGAVRGHTLAPRRTAVIAIDPPPSEKMTDGDTSLR